MRIKRNNVHSQFVGTVIREDICWGMSRTPNKLGTPNWEPRGIRQGVFHAFI